MESDSEINPAKDCTARVALASFDGGGLGDFSLVDGFDGPAACFRAICRS